MYCPSVQGIVGIRSSSNLDFFVKMHRCKASIGFDGVRILNICYRMFDTFAENASVQAIDVLCIGATHRRVFTF